jgi:hypothetical protein
MAQQNRDVREPGTVTPHGATGAGGTAGTGTGPHSEIGRPSRRVWWIAGLAAVAVVAVVWAVAAAGDGGSPAPASPRAGEVTSPNGRNVLALARDATALASLDGQTVEGKSVPVQGFIPGAGFWVGTDTRRLFIGEPNSPSFGTGAVIDFTGVITALPSDFKTAFGVVVPHTARVLGHEGVYIVPQKITVSTG